MFADLSKTEHTRNVLSILETLCKHFHIHASSMSVYTASSS